MSDVSPAATRKMTLDLAVEIAVRLAVIALVTWWCFYILRPFILPIIWGTIIAVALARPFGRLVALMGGRRGPAAVVFTLAAVFLIVLPTFRIADSVVRSSIGLAQGIEEQTLVIPPAKESVQDWPLIGDRVYEAWNLAATNLDAAVARFSPQLRALGRRVLGTMRGLLGDVLQTIIALIVAGFMLTFSQWGETAAAKALGRVGGARGAGMVGLAAATIRSVALGVLGVAVIQAALGGLAMFLVHVPAWGVWTVLILILAVMQLPPLIVLAPAIFWVFSAVDSTAVAILFTVWSIVVSVSDSFLKPLFLGRGLEVPMPVILLGAIGGLIRYGLVGLFVGAVVLAIGYQLYQAWLTEQADAPTVQPDMEPAGG